MKKKIVALVLPFLFLLSTVNSSVTVCANATNNSIPITSAPSPSTVFRFDGKVTAGEWNENHTIALTLDVGNGDGDIDGENYLYLGQDNVSLFLAFDFATDATDDKTGEWFGVWLNAADRSFSDYQGWHDHINNGTESVIYDTENKREWIYFDTVSTGSNDLEFTSDTEYSVTNGTQDGYYYDFVDMGVNNFTITSELISGRELFSMDVSLNVSKLFTIFPELYSNELTKFNLFYYYALNETIEEHKLIVWNPDGSIPPYDDPHQVINLDSNAGSQSTTREIGVGNKTDDHMIQFTLFGNSSSSFNNSIDRMGITVTYRLADSPTTGPNADWVKYPYTSLNIYGIAWSFGSSPTNATSHRMYEMVIPLSELEGYNKTTHELGIVIGGYGTVSFPTLDYWAWPHSSPPSLLPYPLEDSTLYHYIKVNSTRLYKALPPFLLGVDDDDDDDGEGDLIPFGNYYLFFVAIGIIALVIIHWKRKSMMEVSK